MNTINNKKGFTPLQFNLHKKIVSESLINQQKNKHKLEDSKIEKGFTLIEILVVIGMIAILATIVIIAINPGRQFASGRNTQRTSNINTILNAIGQNIADNHGSFNCPNSAIDSTPRDISSSSTQANIMPCLVPTYMPSVLVDPEKGVYNSTSSYDSMYFISQDVNNRYTVTATSTELGGALISATR